VETGPSYLIHLNVGFQRVLWTSLWRRSRVNLGSFEESAIICVEKWNSFMDKNKVSWNYVVFLFE